VNKFKDTPDNHDFMSPGAISEFLRNHNTGINNRGRAYLATIINDYTNPLVVDAACGTCVNWEVFRHLGSECRYIGVDRCEGMLREAGIRYGQEIETLSGYVQELPFADNEADIVIMRHILEHLQEGYEDAIREGLRVAKHELVIVFFIDPSNEAEDDISESEPDEHSCTYFWNTYSWDKFIRFIVEFGFKFSAARIETPGAAHADTIVRIQK
jgi:ubiquinone/menaquinone biosynthesis C-methylase UbiE